MELKRYRMEYEFFDWVEDPEGDLMSAKDVLQALYEFNERINKAQQMAPEMHKRAIEEKDKIISQLSHEYNEQLQKTRDAEWMVQNRERIIRELEKGRDLVLEEKVKEKLARAGRKVGEAVRRAEDAEFNAKTARNEVERLRVINARLNSVLRGVRNMVMGELGV